MVVNDIMIGSTNDPASENVIVSSGMPDLTSGTKNVAMGVDALSSNTSGTNNSAFGYGALRDNTTGLFNTAAGSQSLLSNTTGTRNTALGHSALRSSVSSDDNTAVGYFALVDNNSGHSNTAVGAHAMRWNTSGTENTALGESALFDNTTGDHNTAVGVDALRYNTTASDNTAVGYGAMGEFPNVPGGSNVAIGYLALRAGGGSRNTAVGAESMAGTSLGDDNACLGHSSLTFNTTGNRNTALGANALNSDIGSCNTGVGFQSGKQHWAAGSPSSYNTYIGAFSGTAYNGNYNYSTAIGEHSTFSASDHVRFGTSFTNSIGGYQGWTSLSDGRMKKNIQEDVVGLDLILKLRPVSYLLDHKALIQSDYSGEMQKERMDQIDERTKKKRETGLVAQEVEAVLTELGIDFSGLDTPDNDKDKYGLRYAMFVVPLVKAVQEQQQLIEDQEEMLEEQGVLLKRLIAR